MRDVWAKVSDSRLAGYGAAALGVAELHDPGTGGADLLQLCPDLSLQALVLDRQAAGGRDRLDDLGLVAQGGVMD